ncbi:MAG: IgGFc-binding protein, partial [Deltaproteobacteria bacterium]|nr:IgGFc-binding protein [Deltaproteobacteria bacterium]
FQMEQFDVLNIETDDIGADMTGSVVLANRDVVVFGGSEASNAPNTNHCLIAEDEEEGVCEWDGETGCEDNDDCTAAGFNTCCADHLEMQLFPVKTWGTHFIASKSFPRNGERDVYRIMAAEDNTLVTTLPVQVNIPVLNRGEWVDFESDKNFEIKGTKPILVGQFLAAEQAPDPNVGGVPGPMDAGTGDPAFILVVPTEQFRKDYIFLAPDKYALDYATVVAPKDAAVWVDCAVTDPALRAESCPAIPEADWSWYMSGEYKTAKFLIADGTHRIDGDQPIAVYVYGYDQYVSYGYPAGLDIKDLGLIKEPGE